MAARGSEKGCAEGGRKMDKRLVVVGKVGGGVGVQGATGTALTPASVPAPRGRTMMMASERNRFLLAQSGGRKIDLKYGGSAHTHACCNHSQESHL